MSETQNLDPAALARLQKLGGDAFAAKMVALFLEYVGAKIVAARQAQVAGDLTGVQDAAHPIKSSAGNVGAGRVQQLAGRIEQLAKQGQAGELPALIGELEAAFAAVKAELQARPPAPGS